MLLALMQQVVGPTAPITAGACPGKYIWPISALLPDTVVLAGHMLVFSPVVGVRCPSSLGVGHNRLCGLMPFAPAGTAQEEPADLPGKAGEAVGDT